MSENATTVKDIDTVSTSSVEIVEVLTKKDLRKWVRFPIKLYKKNELSHKDTLYNFFQSIDINSH